MNNLYLFQIPVSLDDKNPVHFPYSVGLLWSYAQQFKKIKNSYDLKEIVFLREDPELILDRLDNPKVIGFSCYVWNMNYSTHLASRIKSSWPNCTIILGGPHIPLTDTEFFEKHPYCDIVVYREGELVFKELLEEITEKVPDLNKINGIAYNKNNKTIQTNNPVRTEKLDDIPSPYLLGVFDGMKKKCDELGIPINGLLETNRGCPYSCTFCDWGNLGLGKVKKFNLTRVKKELFWFAKNKVEYITNCDANFGIYKDRDLEITEFMIKLKKRYGYPQTFDTNWTKNSNSNTVDLAKMLMDASMLKRFTASIQTTNPQALIAIKRKNLPDNQMEDIISYAAKMGIHTSVDLIMGLPNDTYEKLQKDFTRIIDKGAYPSVSFLNILPNSEMAEPEYRKKYGIETGIVERPLMYTNEQDEFVVSTKTMSRQELQRLTLYCWFVSQFHFQGYTNIIADFMKKKYQIPNYVFYDKFMDLCTEENPNQYPNKLISHYRNHMENGTSGNLDIGIPNMPFHTLIGHDKRYETFLGFKEILKTMVSEKDYKYIDDLILLQESSQYSLYRDSVSYIQTKSNLYEYIYNDQPLKGFKKNYKVIQRDVKIRNYGEFMIQNRFNSGYKTQIVNLEQKS